MKRLISSAVLGAFAAALLAPAGATAAEFSAYVGCGTTENTPPAKTCTLGQTPGAFFEAIDEDIEYDVCVESPSGEYECAKNQQAEEGVLYVNAITTTSPGYHFVDWHIEGEMVESWGFEMVTPAPPPAPAAPAPAPAPLVTPPAGPSAACKKAAGKVQRLKTKLSKAAGKKAKSKIRPKLKEAKAKKKSAC